MKGKSVQAAVAAAVMSVGVLSSPSAHSAVDMFFKLGDIKGESSNAKYKDWIDVLSWTWGASQNTAAASKGRVRGPSVCVEELKITKRIDKATPDLVVGTTLGDHFPQAELVLRQSGEDSMEFLRFKMQDVVVTSYATGGTTGQESFVEHLSLSFQNATGEYIPQAGTGGSGAPIVFDVDASSSKCK